MDPTHILRFSRKLFPYDDRERRSQCFDFTEFRSSKKPPDSLGQPGDVFFNTNELALHVRFGGSNGWSKPWDGSFKNRIPHPQFENRYLWIEKGRKRLEFRSNAIIQKNLFMVSTFPNLLQSLVTPEAKLRPEPGLQSNLGKRKTLAGGVDTDADGVQIGKRGRISVVEQPPGIPGSLSASMNERIFEQPRNQIDGAASSYASRSGAVIGFKQNLSMENDSRLVPNPLAEKLETENNATVASESPKCHNARVTTTSSQLILASTQTSPRTTSPDVPNIITLSEPETRDLESELSELSDLTSDDEFDELLMDEDPGPSFNHKSQPQQNQASANMIHNQSTNASQPAVFTSVQSSSSASAVGVQVVRTQLKAADVKKPPIIIEDSDSEDNNHEVETRKLPSVPERSVAVPGPSHLTNRTTCIVSPELRKAQSSDEPAQIIDLTLIEDEGQESRANLVEPRLQRIPIPSSSGSRSAMGLTKSKPSFTSSPNHNSHRHQSQPKSPSRFFRATSTVTGTGKSVVDAINLDGVDDESDGSEILNLTLEEYQAGIHASQSPSRMGRKGKAKERDIGIEKNSRPLIDSTSNSTQTPTKSKVRNRTQDDQSHIATPSQASSHLRVGATPSSSSDPSQPKGGFTNPVQADGLRNWHLGLLYRKFRSDNKSQTPLMVYCACCKDEVTSSQTEPKTPPVVFLSNAVCHMLQHVRDMHSESAQYQLVVGMSREEVELQIQEDRQKRRCK
ncbi:hypothetical protein BT96DRAFT_918852 [Gymnopus androsaceus JB14]|uniref:Uncharacterized protein n=1 Tax=Gymnopus androsaceus JB14 TaxID=1447944 RepID=A0A6A4HT98_9AGAR|nr:hypothetical protein BT96DRAFT_918852 [Gymnopus androsaceus JB14]